ncbi:hypothetical protein SEVIR_6G106501v4 [Setaria viridis]
MTSAPGAERATIERSEERVGGRKQASVGSSGYSRAAHLGQDCTRRGLQPGCTKFFSMAATPPEPSAPPHSNPSSPVPAAAQGNSNRRGCSRSARPSPHAEEDPCAARDIGGCRRPILPARRWGHLRPACPSRRCAASCLPWPRRWVLAVPERRPALPPSPPFPWQTGLATSPHGFSGAMTLPTPLSAVAAGSPPVLPG